MLYALKTFPTLKRSQAISTQNHKDKKGAKGTPTIKQVLPSEKEKRSMDDLFVLLFTRIALQGIVCYTYKSVLSGGKYKWNVLPSKTWNNVLTHIVKYLTSFDVKWNLPVFAKRTFHICEANISPRSDFTCPNGQISLGDLLYSRSPNLSFFFVVSVSCE